MGEAKLGYEHKNKYGHPFPPRIRKMRRTETTETILWAFMVPKVGKRAVRNR